MTGQDTIRGKRKGRCPEGHQMRVPHQQPQARAHVLRERKHALTSLKRPKRKADPLPGVVHMPRDRALLPPKAHVPASPPPAPEQAEWTLPQSEPSQGLPPGLHTGHSKPCSKPRAPHWPLLWLRACPPGSAPARRPSHQELLTVPGFPQTHLLSSQTLGP